MANPFKAPKAKPPVVTPPVETAEEPVDSEALARARKRAEDAKRRRGRDDLRIDLTDTAAGGQSGLYIP